VSSTTPGRAPTELSSRPRTALVLGAGGLMGLAYHAGVLRALEKETDFRAADVDLMIGTSAGAVIAAYLRAGWGVEDLWNLAMDASRLEGTTPPLPKPRRGRRLPLGATAVLDRQPGAENVPAPPVGGMAEWDRHVMAPAFRTPLDLCRRGLGAAYVLSRSVLRLPGPALPPLPAAVTALIPGGLFTMPEGRRRLAADLPEAWPAGNGRELWLVAYDIHERQRVVLGRHGTPRISLIDAVLASSAIPGVYAPVPLDGMSLVDGGVSSTTHLNLATSAGCKRIICSAPMAYDEATPPSAIDQMIRRWSTKALVRETGAARAKGVTPEVYVPSQSEIRMQGLNFMRPGGLQKVAEAAYESTLNRLDEQAA
jgi:NTE family protein